MTTIRNSTWVDNTSFWKATNACKLCWYGPCLCHFTTSRQSDGKGPYECEPAPKDEHTFPHDPMSEYRAERFINELRNNTRQSRMMRGCDPITGEKLRDEKTE